MAVGIAGLFLSACAFDLAHVTYTAATFQSAQNSARTVVLFDEVPLTDTPCSYSRTLRKTTR